MTLRAGTALAALLVALTGCAVGPAGEELGGASSPLPAPAAPATAAAPVRAGATSDGRLALVATLRGVTRIHAAAAGPVRQVQDDMTDEGTRQRLLVLEDEGDWLRVALPGRPNGRTGWIRAGSVDLAATDWRMEVSLGQRTLTVLRGGLVYGTHAVAVGAGATPTPEGMFFVTDLLAPPDPAGPYGPYAFGISAYSDVVTSFGKGGRGQIGLHGTNDPASIGRPVSNGCLRLDNNTIRTLAEQLPLGTPFQVRA